jgi:ribosomal protein S18 acetylase RimI-like enzyme
MFSYREAKETDIVAICELGEEVNAVHHRVFPQVFAGSGERDRDAAHWLNGISKPDAITIVAEENDSIVGFVNVSIVNETHSLLQPLRFGRVGSVSVTENRRGQGIGRELMIRAQDWVTSRGGTEVRLNVWAFNTRALRMYEELGYETRSLFLAKQLPSGA